MPVPAMSPGGALTLAVLAASCACSPVLRFTFERAKPRRRPLPPSPMVPELQGLTPGLLGLPADPAEDHLVQRLLRVRIEHALQRDARRRVRLVDAPGARRYGSHGRVA